MNLKSLPDLLAKAEHIAASYALIFFLLLLATVYGFVLYEINNYSSAQPSSDEISAKVQAAATPHVSQSVVDQIQSLQDHSVSIKALFDQARSNPFQE